MGNRRRESQTGCNRNPDESKTISKRKKIIINKIMPKKAGNTKHTGREERKR